MSAFASLVRLRSIAAIAVAVPALAAGLSTAAADTPVAPGRPWVWPLGPRPDLVDPFDPPDTPYGPGNRGVDLAGTVGQRVLAVADGVVAYAGAVGGRGVVVVSHGPLRSTYEPVTATVEVGDAVRAGQPLGVLAAVGSPCPPGTCLHLGILRGTRYVDPLWLLGDPPIRLKPLTDPVGWPAAPSRSAAADAATAAAGYPWPVVR
jgi:murein DD-endopeptidase MepM/ murein hydrolase activator NlpD